MIKQAIKLIDELQQDALSFGVDLSYILNNHIILLTDIDLNYYDDVSDFMLAAADIQRRLKDDIQPDLFNSCKCKFNTQYEDENIVIHFQDIIIYRDDETNLTHAASSWIRYTIKDEYEFSIILTTKPEKTHDDEYCVKTEIVAKKTKHAKTYSPA